MKFWSSVDTQLVGCHIVTSLLSFFPHLRHLSTNNKQFAQVFITYLHFNPDKIQKIGDKLCSRSCDIRDAARDKEK